MVAIVSGNSLGLSLGSLATLGQRGQLGTAGQGRNAEQAYVNIANGNLILQDLDDKLVARGADIGMVRTYNSQGLLNDDNGDNWVVGAYGQRVVLTGTVATAGSTLLRTDRDGASATYTWDAGRSRYVSNAGSGAFDAIAYDATNARYIWTDGDTGLVERYESTGQGKLMSVADPAGNTVSYAYNANGTVKSVTDANGEVSYYDYSSTNPTQLTQLRTVAKSADGNTDVTLTRVRYAYDSANRLSTVTVDLSPEDNAVSDGKTYLTTYTYDGTSKRVASVTQKDGTSLAFTYVQVGADYRVATVKDGLGQTTSYSYNTTATPRTTTVTDPLGLVTTYTYDAAGQLTQVSAPPVGGIAQITTFVYDAAGNVTKVTDPKALAVDMTYDANGNQLSQRDAAGNTITRTFDVRNQLLTETVYLTPDPDGAGAGLPAQPLTTRYVYDAAGKNQLRFVLSPEGRVVEYRYDSYGQRTSSLEYAAAKYNVTALAATAVPTEADLTTWVGSQDRTQASRTDTVYDARGQVQKVTVFGRVDASGNGVADASQSITQYVYDRAGLLLSTISAITGTTTFTYDGKGRQLSAQDALGQTTLTSYDDINNKTVITQANGLITTSAYDKNGRLVSVTQGSALNASLGVTTNYYDKNGRLYQQTDATGARTAGRLYDEAGRLVGEIDGLRRLTEYIYDKNNQLTQKISYATPVNLTALTAYFTDPSAAPVNRLATLRPAKSTADQRSWRIYDGAGRLVRTVDGAGAVVDMRYDGASRLVGTTQYNKTLDASVLDALTGEPTLATTAIGLDVGKDRITRRLYDGDGKLVGTLDAEGYFTESRYDAQGRLITQVSYAAQITDATLLASGTFAQLVTNASSQAPLQARNQTSRWLYDAQDRVIGQIDAEGYLTENVYDASGNITSAKRYNTALGAAVLDAITTATTLASLRTAAGINAADRTTTSVYDKLNRVVTRTNFEGTVTQYVYDKLGNVATTTSAAGTTDVRVVNARYDVQGRLVGELTGVGSALLVAGQTQAQIDAIWTQYGLAHAYDSAGRRISTTDANGNKTLFFYDANGQLTHTVNALGEVIERQYNIFGQLEATLQIGTRLTSLAGLSGGLVTIANTTTFNAIKNAAFDTKQSFTYTVRGHVSTAKDALGNSTVSGYNAFGELTGVTKDLGSGVQRVQSMTVDRRGLITGTVSDASGVNAITSAVYDAFGRRTRSVDANGNVQQQSFDRLGRVLNTTDALNAVRSTTYDAFERITTQTDALGRVTSYTYDNTLRTVTIKTPENVTVKTTYTRQGQRLSVVDGNGNTTTYAYDKNGNLLSTTVGGTVTSSSYDRTDRLIQTKDANGNLVDLTYDAVNRVLTRTLDKTGLNLVTIYAYDAKGQQFNVTDPNGTLTKLTYDLKGQLIRKEVDPTGLNLATQYTYDGVGNTLTVIDPNGVTTQYVYDKLGRRTQERVDPAGLNLTRSYIYDKDGNVTSATDANNQVTRYVYDAEDRLVYTLDPTAGLQRIRYDTEGRIVQTTRYATPVNLTGLPAAPAALTREQLDAKVPVASAGDSTEHRVLDKDGRLAATVNGLGEVVTYIYDANGNVIERRAFATPIALANWTVGTVPAPTAVDARDLRQRTVYDQLNRATYTIDGVGAVTRNVYDANGNVVERNAYAATVPVTTAATVAALSAAIAPLASAARDVREVMVYDRANRMSASTNGVGTVTQRTYDKNGNVTSISSSASGPNLLTQSEFANGLTDLQVRAGALTATTMAGYAGALKVDASATTATTAYKQLTTTPGATYTLSVIVQMDDGLAPSFGSATFKDAKNSFVLVMLNGAKNPQQYIVQDLGGGRYRVSVTAASGGTYNGFGIVKYIENDARGFKITGYQLEQASAAGSYTPTGATTVAAGAPRAITRYAYDAAGRLIYTVGPLGEVEKNSYDAAGRLTLTTRLAKAISTAGLGATPTLAQIDALVKANTNLLTQSEFTNGLGDAPYKTGAVTVSAMTGFAGALRLASDPAGSSAYKPAATTPGATYTLSVIVEMEDGQPPSFVSTSASSTANSFGLALFSGATNPTTYVVQNLGSGRYRVSVTGVAPASRGVYFGAVKYAGNDSRAFRVTGYQLEETSTAGSYTPTTTASTEALDQLQHSVYDKAGRLVASVDGLGNVVKYTLDANGNVAEKRAYYNPINLTSWVRGTVPAPTNDDARDQRTRTFVDAVGREALRVDALGNVQRSEYDAVGRPTRITRFPKAVPATTANTYQALLDAANAQASATLPAQITVFVYDAAGRKVSQTAAYGRPEAATTAYVYDGLGLLIKTVEARGVELSQSDSTWALVQRQQLGYVNAAGGGLLLNALTQAEKDGFAARYTTVNAYDAAGRKISVTDPLGKVTESSYDANGNVVKITDPLRNEALFYFDAAGRVTLSVDPEGYATATAYDTLGKTLSVKRYYNKVVGTYSTTQAPALPAAHASDALTQFAYDASGRLLRTTDAENRFESYTYNALGQRETLTNKLTGVTTYAYDRLGRVVGESLPITSKNASGQPVAVVNQSVYDAFGNKTVTTEAAGLPEQRVTTYSYDGLNRQLTVRQASVSVYTAAGGWTTATPTRTNTYDASGNLIVSVDANGGRTRNWYDANNRKVAEVNATGTLSTWSYDPAGNVLIQRVFGDPQTLPAGDALPQLVNEVYAQTATNVRTTVFKVDANNRTLSSTIAKIHYGVYNSSTSQYEDGVGNLVTESAYDANGQVVRQKNGVGAVTYVWFDKLGQKVLEIDPMGYAVRWERDTNGRVTRETRYAQPLGPTDLGLLSESYAVSTVLAKIPADTGNRVTEYTYDRNGRTLSESRLAVAYGSVSASGALTESTAAAITRYGYDPMGNRTSMTDALNQRTDLDYDLLGRLLSERKPVAADNTGAQVRQTTEYEYDGLNNVRREIRRGTNAAVETDDQIVRYNYDATGVRTSMVTANKGETFTYGRDANGNTTAQMMDRLDAEGNVSREIVSIAYDAANRETTRFTGTRDAANAPIYDIAKTVTTSYNAYGQIASRRTGAGNSTGAAQEYFDYDAAGRLWRTNSQDGINKAWLYDLAGNAVMASQSQTIDMRTLTMEQIISRVETLKTITAYDKNNRAISVTQPKVTAARPNLVMVATPLDVQAEQFGGLNIAFRSASDQETMVGPTGTAGIGTGRFAAVPMTVSGHVVPQNGMIPSYFNFDGLSVGSAEMAAATEALYGNITTWKVAFRGLLNDYAEPGVVRYAAGGGTWPKYFTELGNYGAIAPAYLGSNVYVSVYAVTASGVDVKIAENTIIPAQARTTATSNPTGTFLRLSQGEIPIDAKVELYNRPLGSSGPFEQGLWPFRAGQSGSSLNNASIAGWYFADVSSLNAPTEFRLVVTLANGTVLRRQSMPWTPPGYTGSVPAMSSVGNADKAPIFTSNGLAHFSGLHPSSDATPTSGRPAAFFVSQRAWGSTSAYTTSYHTAWPPGQFATAFDPGERDVVIDMLDGNGVVLDSIRGKVDAQRSIYQMQPKERVRFQGIPLNAKTVTVEFTLNGLAPASPGVTPPAGPQSSVRSGTATLVRRAGSAEWLWDADGSGLVPGYLYDLRFVAKDGDGFRVSEASGQVALEAAGRPAVASLSGIYTSRILAFDAGVAGAQSMRLRYREKGAGAQSIPLYGPPVVTSKNADGTLNFGQGYSATIISRDGFGNPIYGNVKAVPTPVYVEEQKTATRTVQAGMAPMVIGSYFDYDRNQTFEVYQLDDGGNPVMVPVYKEETYTYTVSTLVKTIPAPTDPSKYVIGYQALDFQEVTIQRAPSGLFKWDATAVELNSDKEYEYMYDVYDASGKTIGNGDGYFRADSNKGNDKANVNIKWIIPNLPGGPTVSGEPDVINSQWQVQRRQDYNAFGEVISETDGKKNLTSLAYNALGQLTDKRGPETKITLSNGQSLLTSPSEHYSYDLKGQLVGKRDANGNQSTVAINAAGQAVTEWHPGAAPGSLARVLKTYDIFGNLRTVIDEIGRVTNNEYDFNNRLTKVLRPVNDDGTTRAFDLYEYDILGQRIAHTNAMGFKERTYYDSKGRVTQYVSAEGNTVSYGYTYDKSIGSAGGVNTGGWVYTTTDANGRVQTLKNDVFNRLMWKQDLGGHQFTYSYNWSGLIATQIGTSGQNITYGYYGNGYLKQVIDAGASTESTFEYDSQGNRTFEGLKSTTGATMVFQQSYVIYDEFNRVRTIEDGRYTINYEYDANGNRRRVRSVYNDGINGTKAGQDYWYQYDGMDRFTITMGQMVNGQITAGTSGDGVNITYDAAGQRKSATYAKDGHVETYAYDGAGGLTKVSIDGVLRSRRTNDLAGRVTLYEELNVNQTVSQSLTRAWNKDNQLMQEHDNLTNGGTVYTRMKDGTLSETMTSSLDPAKGSLALTHNLYEYEWWDTAKQKVITTKAADSSLPAGSTWAPGYALFAYDVNGHIKTASDPTGRRTFSYWTTAEGQVLQRDELMGGTFNASTGQIDGGSKNRTHRYFYFDGKRVGNVGNDGTEREDYAQQLARNKDSVQGPDAKYRTFSPTNSADFDENYQPINAGYPGPAPGSYTVRSGDTLENIARALWGDAKLWYVLAEANGLDGQPSAPLVENTVLSVPSRVLNVHNTSNTFRPYDPGKAMGDTSPTLPEPVLPPPKAQGGGCGGFGKIVTIVVAVVASLWTAGMAGAYFGVAGAGTGGVAGGLGILGTAGGLTAGAIGVTALGGAVGSIASQAVGIAIGAQDSFSWKGVALGALGAGVSAGVGSWLNTGAAGSWLVGKEGLATAGRMAISNIATQGLSIVTGLQQSFDWRGVAASAASGYVSASAGAWVKGMDWSPAGQSLASSMAGGLASAAVRGGSISRALPGIIGDAVGTAMTVGNALGDLIAASNGQGSSGGRYRGVVPSNPYGYQGSGGGVTNWEANSAAQAAVDGQWFDAQRDLTLAGLKQEASLPSSVFYSAPRAGGMAALPVEVQQSTAIGSDRSYRASGWMTPVASGINEYGNPYFLWDSVGTTRSDAIPEPGRFIETYSQSWVENANGTKPTASLDPVQSGWGNIQGAIGAYWSRSDVTLGQAVSAAWNGGGNDLLAGIGHSVGAGTAAIGATLTSPTVVGAVGLGFLAAQQTDAAIADYRRFFGGGDERGAQSLFTRGLTPVIGSGGAAYVNAGIDFAFGIGTTGKGLSAAEKRALDNTTYRNLNSTDPETLEAGLGLKARAPDGAWTAEQHVLNAGPQPGGAMLNDPWISSSWDYDLAKNGYNSGNGLVSLNLGKIPSEQIEVWKNLDRSNRYGVSMAYHRSIWAQEVTIYQNVPARAIGTPFAPMSQVPVYGPISYGVSIGGNAFIGKRDDSR